MLEADGIYQRIIVISAIDEDVLKRAIKWKYSLFFNDDKETFMRHRDTHKHKKVFPYRNKKKSEELDDLVKEYMDKLFLIGIKLGQLTDDEKEEIFGIYTISRDIVAPNQEDRPVKKETATETDSRAVTPTKSVAGDEPKEESNEEEQRGDNIEGKEEENKYELRYEEYELLSEYIKLLEDATPREVRIFYYRYLLARNLLEISLRSKELERIWSQETDKSAIPRLILNESNPTKKLFSFNNKESSNSTSDKNNMIINPKILEKLTKIIDMVVAY
jgi:hypothetical protein